MSGFVKPVDGLVVLYCRFNDPAVLAKFDEVEEVDGVFLPVKGAEEPCDGCSNPCYPVEGVN